MSAPTAAEKTHVDVFDGLRAMAIAMVMWLHTWQLSWIANTAVIAGVSISWGVIPETGFLGVELFFFISGFCLFYPYARHRLEGAPLASLGTYLYRRAIKILPSYWLCAAVLIALTQPAFGTAGSWLWQLGTHLCFVHNWWNETENTINGVFWSLAVEVQFYALFPLLALAFMRWPLVTYGALAGLALGWRSWIMAAFPASAAPWLLNQLPGYIDFFACGMLAAYVLVAWRGRPSFGRWPWAWALAAVASVGALGRLMNDLYGLRYVMPFWPCGWQVEHRTYLGWAFLAIAVASAGAARPWRLLLTNAPLRFLSTISYNLYLWHQVIARALFNAHLPRAAMADPHHDATWQWQYMALSWTASIAVAALITYAFERPLLKHGVRGALARLRLRLARPDRPGMDLEPAAGP